MQLAVAHSLYPQESPALIPRFLSRVSLPKVLVLGRLRGQVSSGHVPDPVADPDGGHAAKHAGVPALPLLLQGLPRAQRQRVLVVLLGRRPRGRRLLPAQGPPLQAQCRHGLVQGHDRGLHDALRRHRVRDRPGAGHADDVPQLLLPRPPTEGGRSRRQGYGQVLRSSGSCGGLPRRRAGQAVPCQRPDEQEAQRETVPGRRYLSLGRLLYSRCVLVVSSRRWWLRGARAVRTSEWFWIPPTADSEVRLGKCDLVMSNRDLCLWRKEGSECVQTT